MLKKFLLLLSVAAGNYCFAQYSPLKTPGPSPAPVVSADDLARLTDDRRGEQTASDERISVVRLSHKPSRKARAAFSRGWNLAKNDACQEAAAEFEKAVALDPEFSEAFGDLGVEYTCLGRWEQAVTAFRRAIQIDPATAHHAANLAFALLQLKRYEEAKSEAEAAISLDAGNANAQFLLGYLLARHPETRQLSESHLTFAAKTVPEAHFVLALVYRFQGAAQRANAELDLYRSATKKSSPTGAMSFLPTP